MQMMAAFIICAFSKKTLSILTRIWIIFFPYSCTDFANPGCGKMVATGNARIEYNQRI